MIDPNLFDTEKLIRQLLRPDPGIDGWRSNATIIPEYMPPFPSENTQPKCVVRYGNWFLRYSNGPRQGYFWDVYGDDFQTPELALLGLTQAPRP